MVKLRHWLPLGLLIIGSFSGCGSLTSGPSLLSSPFFTPTSEDRLHLAKLTHELDNKALHCLEAATCEEVHFARALVSLFENKEAAQASFQQVIGDHPSGVLAGSSKLWLRLIKDEANQLTLANEQQSPLKDVMAQLVRDWMDRQLAEHTDSASADEQSAQVDQLRAAVENLEKQLRERERRIALLRSQLDALKVIDEESQERKRPVKVPGRVLPLTDHHR